MAEYLDQTGRTISLSHTPRRIVSIVPSQTELLASLDLDESVVGITKFCIHPDAWFRRKTRIGGTKQINFEKIAELKPDLIIANKEENVREQVLALAEKYPVWISDVNMLEDALDMIRKIGLITDKGSVADNLSKEIEDRFNALPVSQPRDAAYLIWKDPYMTVGGDTFINDMMNKAGFRNIFSSLTRYPEIKLEQLRGCPLLLLSSEPYPFKEKHLEAMQAELPDTKIVLVDGEMFSWYGSRLLLSPSYFGQLRKFKI